MLAAEYPEFMKTNVKMISGQRGRAAGAPPRGRQILHFLSDQTAPRPAPTRPVLARRHTTTRLFPDLRKYWETRHFTSIYSPILGTLEKFSAIISKIGIWWERGFSLPLNQGTLKHSMSHLGSPWTLTNFAKSVASTEHIFCKVNFIIPHFII